MFTRKINDDLSLALVQPSFVKDYLVLISADRQFFSRYLPWAAHMHSEDDFMGFITHSLQSYGEGKTIPCSMIYKGQLVGNISLDNINHPLKKAKMGYWLGVQYQGLGIVTTAASELIDMAFNELGLTKVEIHAATDNTASRAVPERLGFELEGIITQAENVNGRIVDHAVYGLLKR